MNNVNFIVSPYATVPFVLLLTLCNKCTAYICRLHFSHSDTVVCMQRCYDVYTETYIKNSI